MALISYKSPVCSEEVLSLLDNSLLVSCMSPLASDIPYLLLFPSLSCICFSCVKKKNSLRSLPNWYCKKRRGVAIINASQHPPKHKILDLLKTLISVGSASSIYIMRLCLFYFLQSLVYVCL